MAINITKYQKPILLDAMEDFVISGLTAGTTYSVYLGGADSKDSESADYRNILNESLVADSDGKITIKDMPELLREYIEEKGILWVEFELGGEDFINPEINTEVNTYHFMVYSSNVECEDFDEFAEKNFLSVASSKRSGERRKEMLSFHSDTEISNMTVRAYYTDGTYKDFTKAVTEDESKRDYRSELQEEEVVDVACGYWYDAAIEETEYEKDGTRQETRTVEDTAAEAAETYVEFEGLSVTFHNMCANDITALLWDGTKMSGEESTGNVFLIDSDNKLCMDGLDKAIINDTIEFTDLTKVYDVVECTMGNTKLVSVTRIYDKTTGADAPSFEKKYKVITVNVDYKTGNKTLYRYVVKCGNRSMEYVIDTEHEEPDTAFIFRNCFGAWEAFYCNGMTETEDTFEREGTYINGIYRNYKVTEVKNFNCDTGILMPFERDMAQDLLRSKEIYMCKYIGGVYSQWKKVVITDSEAKHTNEPEGLPRYTFTCRLAQKRQNVLDWKKLPAIFTEQYTETYE